MGKNFLCLAAMLFISVCLCAQLNESFSDGNLTANPSWSGNNSDWQVVANSDVAAGAINSGTLRLNVATGSGSTYLSTQVAGSWGPGQSWGFFVGRRAQAYTAANHTFIWLWASEANLLSASVNGYRIRIGDDAGGDDIVLQKVVNGAPTDILTSATALPNGITDAGFLLRVIRSNTGVWEMFTSVLPSASGTGAVAIDIPNAVNAVVPQGSATDNTFSMFDNGHVGFANVYGSGTAARAAQEFDQIQLSFITGTMPVRLGNFIATSINTGVKLTWDVLEETNVAHYQVQGSGNGSGFTTLVSFKANGRKQYEVITTQSKFYRLKIIDIDGSIGYSRTIALHAKQDQVLRVLYNKPANIISIQHPPVPAQSMLRLINAQGKLVEERSIPPNAGNTTLNISALPRGWYFIEWIAPAHQRSLSRLFTSFSSL